MIRCAKNSFNVTEHQISIKPEFVIEKAYWSKKKKYALKLIRRESGIRRCVLHDLPGAVPAYPDATEAGDEYR